MFKHVVVRSWVCAQLVVLAALTQGFPAMASDTKAVRPQMDLAFCIDTTGSMQSEIDVVKAKTKELVAKLSGGKPAPRIRVALVAYRDRGDQYVTKVYPFTEDIDKIVRDISDLKADGGGDGPESVNEALHVSVHDLSWNADKHTAKVLFLIGDAPPHFYPGDFSWNTESQRAISRGIQINTIGCSGLESYPYKDGVDVFKQIAKLTDGKFEPLAYKQEVVQAGGRKETIISSAGQTYKVKGADDKTWRMGADSLATKGMAQRVAGSGTALGGMSVTAAAPGLARAAAFTDSAAMVTRKDSNLADVLLKGAQDAANKTFKKDLSPR